MYSEKLRHLYSNQKFGHLATVINASILVLIQWRYVNHLNLYIWLGLIGLITAARAAAVRQFLRHKITPDRFRFWGSVFGAGLFASGVVWGLAGLWLFPESSYVHQMFTAFTIGGMVAGASAAYCAFQTAFFAFSLPATLPIIIYSFSFQDSLHIAMSAMMVLFLMLMTATCHRNSRMTDTSMRLKFEKQDLIRFLSQAKEKAESINQELQIEIKERKCIEAKLEKHQRQLASEVSKRTIELQQRNEDLNGEIMERKRVESALRDSEERYRLLIENAIVGIALIQEQEIVFANNYMADLSGYPHEEIIGSAFLDYIHPDDRQMAVENHLKRLQGEEFPNSYPIRMIDKQGEVRWLEVNAVLMSYENKAAILIFLRNITQQRNLESQLFHSEKMASIGQLAAGVAHEINNPVGYVSSNLHTLGEYQADVEKLIAGYQEARKDMQRILGNGFKDDQLSAKIRKLEVLEEEIDLTFLLEDWPLLIGQCQEGMHRIKDIVVDLKDFAHPGDQKKQTADINKCIRSTLNIVWNELKYNSVIIEDLGDIPEIECYPQQLNQVFMNLLVNAAQSIETKGKIKIRTRQVEDVVEISVSDTGCGIPESSLSAIFDPFFTTKPVGKGTGLGLNVAYNIIQKHRGRINVASKVGQGTTFTIRLPFTPNTCS